MTGPLAATVSTTSVDVSAAAGIVVGLLVIAVVTLRLVAAVKSMHADHEPCAELLRAARELYVAQYATLRAENTRLADALAERGSGAGPPAP